ncbi:MAG: helix-turn-helix domain-containing protein [Nitrospinaceae bacterium]|nr:helix-turn-helix domain-containing protein [Nitrospinaceae bacterium]
MPSKKKTTPKKSPSKPKAPEKPPVNGEALFKFLLGQAGGTDAAVKAFAADRFRAMARGTTLAQALETADSEGWGDILRSMTLGALRGVTVSGNLGSRRKRGSAEKTRQAVLGALSKGKPRSAREVAEALSMERRHVARALGDLVQAGAVTRSGSKRDSRYAPA